MTAADTTLFDAAFLRSLERLAFAVRRLRAREGEGRVDRSCRGGRVEFADHRRYVAGDDPRRVDWSVYRRTGQLFVKEYEREDDLTVWLLLDDSASMAACASFRAGARLVYALAYLALSSGSRVRAGLCGGGRLRLSGVVAGVPRVRAVGGFLEEARPAGGSDLDAALAKLPPARRGSRSIVIVSDLLTEQDGMRAVERRSAAGDDVAVLRLDDPSVLTPLSARPAVLVDAETDERRTVPAGADRAARRFLAGLDGRWERAAREHRLRYLPLDVRRPVEELVLTGLREGGLLT